MASSKCAILQTESDSQDSGVDDEYDSKPPETENSIYRYYLSSIKRADLFSFLFFQTLVAFLGCFACKSDTPLHS